MMMPAGGVVHLAGDETTEPILFDAFYQLHHLES
jgi:hypothetical protein